jgi:hypothetical protein
VQWGILAGFQDWYFERMARQFGRGCARAMLFSAQVMREKYKDKTPTYAWFAGQALTTRTAWRQVDSTTFMFERNGLTIKIRDEMSVLDVTQMVIMTELIWSLKGLPGYKQIALIDKAQEEAHRFFQG